MVNGTFIVCPPQVTSAQQLPASIGAEVSAVPEEVLLALSIQSKTNPLAEHALKQLPKLVGCEAHSSTILSEVDLGTLTRLGIRVTEEPISYKKKLYTNNQ